ncbi:Por secretion system C-terminal sorting domain-containing protein [Chitinophaga sp. CF118]|uniref:T9SS type A sorting domain-containing protein n=1 Tax=Chitinophaga sp. CF118 TaxID=1884367 RepID=UPI0008E68A2C|nr:T9SS type A sorting domain-containing protein [Chitinophaga sp. CF118]SFF00872.1 Por secretion system C-terminal sorting domain-containing protein [Chitinophaga sp. CF118]
MRRVKSTILILCLLFYYSLAGAQTNIAPQATSSTSYVSSWETIAALNDNFTPANSNDKSHGAYGNWNNPNTTEWVQYDWSQNYTVTSIEVYWFNDAGGVLTPTTAYADYWNGSSWIRLGNIPLQTNAFNVLSVASVSTNRIRVSMLNKSQSTGLLEWRVIGTTVGGPVDTTTTGGKAYVWPAYSPTIKYNFRDEFPSLPAPSSALNDCPQVAGTQSSQWWAFRWGPNKNSLVTTAAITPLLARMNTDFAYFRDQMGWPPDLRAKKGYFSSVYLYGSGLCTDNAPNTELGGWQSTIYYNGVSWPMVLASYYPIYSYDPACTYSDREFQKGAMVHEGIHALLADLPGVKKSAWFQEGGNVWLQQTADARRSNNFNTMGDLNGTDFIAPFMPIECYSGWLQDGSFGGPSAEGVNMFNGNQQICTWRTFLGGHQYSSSFPTFLGNTLGDGAVPWIWRNAPGRVLEGIASGVGATQMRRLITEYRAKQALVDFGPWNKAILGLLNGHFGQSIGAEWQPSWLKPAAWIATPYVKTTNNAGLLTPDTTTLPGWSGANQIPLQVTGNMVTVNFEPIGANMTCQLVYRSTTGVPVYSQFVSSGTCSLKLDVPPASGVVIAVITNTDYIYNGETTRKAHYDYRLRLVTGVTGTASVNTKWYNSATLASARTAGDDTADEIGIDWSKYCNHSFENTREVAEVKKIVNPAEFLMYPNPVVESTNLKLEFTNAEMEKTVITIIKMTGERVFETVTVGKNYIINTKNLKSGFYLVRIKNSKTNTTQKLVVM